MSSVSIEKLVGRANYGTWKTAAEAYLDDHDLWECIEPELNQDGTPKPIDPKKSKKGEK